MINLYFECSYLNLQELLKQVKVIVSFHLDEFRLFNLCMFLVVENLPDHQTEGKILTEIVALSLELYA